MAAVEAVEEVVVVRTAVAVAEVAHRDNIPLHNEAAVERNTSPLLREAAVAATHVVNR